MRLYLIPALMFPAAIFAAPKFTIQPLTAKPGESINIVVSSAGCDVEFDAKSVHISGGDVTFNEADVSVTNCALTIPAKIAAKPSSRQARIAVTKKGAPAEELVHDVLSIVDIPPSAIPPGINPQVDVLWSVLSESSCSDQFGLRLARRYFCVDVQLGNNSGYPLILSGVGFLRRGYALEFKESTASYLTVRSTVQREQVVSGRNITLRGLQAVGVTIAGFTPFSGNAGRRGRIGLWSTLVGGIIATAYDGLVPDRTVRQASNLDDAALRDGRLIPNNSPARFMVFVDRETIRPIFPEIASQIDSRLEKEQKLLQNLPPAVAEAERARLSKRREQNSAAALKTNKHRNPLGRDSAPLEKDLVAVRLALGSLIFVGDQIEYKQRIQVDANAVNPEIQPSPQVREVEGAPERDKPVNLTILGKNLQKAAVSLLNCNSTTFSKELDPAGSFINLKAFKVPADCTDKAIKLVINTGGGTPEVITIPVILQKPSIEFESVNTGKAAADGSLTIKLKGNYLAGATATVAGVVSKTQAVTVTAATVFIAKDDLPKAEAIPDKVGLPLKIKVSTSAGESNELTFTLTK